MGRFRVHGRAGLNRVRFSGRVGRRMLGPGTYRIRAFYRPGRPQLPQEMVTPPIIVTVM